MKINLKMLLVAFVLSASGGAAFAQGPHTADMEDIVTPVTIAKTIDIRFSSQAIPPSLTSSITVSPTGSYFIYVHGSNAYPAPGNCASAACFSLTGQPGYLYAITLPSSCVVMDKYANYILVDKFTSLPDGNGILSDEGLQLLKIGATFRIYDHPIPGSNAINTGPPVIVNYN